MVAVRDAFACARLPARWGEGPGLSTAAKNHSTSLVTQHEPRAPAFRTPPNKTHTQNQSTSRSHEGGPEALPPPPHPPGRSPPGPAHPSARLLAGSAVQPRRDRPCAAGWPPPAAGPLQRRPPPRAPPGSQLRSQLRQARSPRRGPCPRVPPPARQRSALRAAAAARRGPCPSAPPPCRTSKCRPSGRGSSCCWTSARPSLRSRASRRPSR